MNLAWDYWKLVIVLYPGLFHGDSTDNTDMTISVFFTETTNNIARATVPVLFMLVYTKQYGGT